MPINDFEKLVKTQTGIPDSLPASATHRATICNLCHVSSRELVFRKDGFDLVQCQSCGLLYLLNPPDDAERERHYSFASGYHGELVDAADAIARHAADARRNLRFVAKHARPGRLVDIGCSTGLFLCAARSKGWIVRGLEYSPDSARIAREMHGLEVDQGELQADTYPPETFDVVTMWDVIEHVPDPRKTLEIARDMLVRDGRLILKTPNADGLYPKASLAAAGLLNYWGHPEPPGHLFQFSTATLPRLLDIAGFDLLEVCHRRIPIRYSFGNVRGWFRSGKWLAYCMAFAPLAMLGPYLHRGDDITVAARKRC